jgi:Ni,Fe-hydrogenase III large subunit/Ni,Fe-hydrogenase III component G
MHIEDFIREFKKVVFNTDIEIKNSNEAYIYTIQPEVRYIVARLTDDFGLSFMSEFCFEENVFIINVVFASREGGFLVILRYNADGYIDSLTPNIPRASIYEREIADLYGLKIMGSFDTRCLVKHENWDLNEFPLRKDFDSSRKINEKNNVPKYLFESVKGEDGFQIPVGPVHAGIIEPGHFRFTVCGEPIDNLEIRLMYKHRGIEKICESKNFNLLPVLMERVSGDSSAAYALAYALAIEKITGKDISPEIKAFRTVIVELERIYNFLEDIAGICTDIAFSYPSKKFSYLSELVHQICEELTGSRFLRSAIIPNGSGIDFAVKDKDAVINKLSQIIKRFKYISDMTAQSVSFLDRVEHTGCVSMEEGVSLGLTGVVARACGIGYDVRKTFPYNNYSKIFVQDVSSMELGGVYERFQLKVKEIFQSYEFILKSFEEINIDIIKIIPPINLPDHTEVFSMVETVKGELLLYIRSARNNHPCRVYFKTPSFSNWSGLEHAVRKEIVPDFPLCNKSFNMSYSENDR